MTATDIQLERETANDEFATVVAIHVSSGSAVEKDQLLFDIENSKATQEVEAPAGGILLHSLQIGDTVGFGVPLARIVPADGSSDALPPPTQTTQDSVEPAPQEAIPQQLHPVQELPPLPRRVSAEAAELLSRHGLSANIFATDFITTRTIQAHLGVPGPRPTGLDKGLRPPAAGLAALGTPVPNRKRLEIEALQSGAGNMMLSVLGTQLGAMRITRPNGDFLENRITDLVIHESARLMRKYPRLNAGFADGRVVEHKAVHAGMAIDGGGRLMVYGIANADRICLADLGETMAEAVGRYVENALTAEDVTRATYTVTDLSDAELDFVFPLLPVNQSCIIGITRSAQGGFRLFAGFDHRVTEGREVALFLSELRDRLLSFGSDIQAVAAAEHCAYCSQSLAEATSKGRSKGFLKILDQTGQDVLCCASCWHGW